MLKSVRAFLGCSPFFSSLLITSHSRFHSSSFTNHSSPFLPPYFHFKSTSPLFHSLTPSLTYQSYTYHNVIVSFSCSHAGCRSGQNVSSHPTPRSRASLIWYLGSFSHLSFCSLDLIIVTEDHQREQPSSNATDTQLAPAHHHHHQNPSSTNSVQRSLSQNHKEHRRPCVRSPTYTVLELHHPRQTTNVLYTLGFINSIRHWFEGSRYEQSSSGYFQCVSLLSFFYISNLNSKGTKNMANIRAH